MVMQPRLSYKEKMQTLLLSPSKAARMQPIPFYKTMIRALYEVVPECKMELPALA